MYNKEQRKKQYKKELEKKIKHEEENGLELLGIRIRVSDFVKQKLLSGKIQILVIDGKVLQFHKDYKHGYWVNNTFGLRLHREKLRLELGLTKEQMKNYDVHHIDRNRDNNDISNLQLLTKREHTKLHALEDGKTLSEYKAKVPKPEFIVKICEQCGEEYNSSKNVAHKQRFCSEKCKMKWRRANGLDREERVCIYCGKTFTCNKTLSTKFCSKRCAGKYNYHNNKNSRKCNELNIKYRKCSGK